MRIEKKISTREKNTCKEFLNGYNPSVEAMPKTLFNFEFRENPEAQIAKNPPSEKIPQTLLL